nr:hypothetical protein [Phenylobacterium soli]
MLGLNKLGIILYCSDLWRTGRLGWRGQYGGYLGLAAPTLLLDDAPYPFDLGGTDHRAEVEEEASGDAETADLLVEETYFVTEPRSPMQVRLYSPGLGEDGRWRCRVQIDSPIEIDRYVKGDSGLEALWRAICLVSGELYGSPLWQAGKLGHIDEPGGFLGLPSPASLAPLTGHSF